MRKLIAVLFGAALLVTSGAVGSAQANLITHCVGVAGAVTVPGDLVIPAGESCSLSGTTINGNVRVAADASLVGEEITVNGNVTGQAEAYLDLTDSEVSGNVINRGAYGVYLDRSDANAYTSTANVNPETFLASYQSTFSGRIAVSGGSFLLESSEVNRFVEVDEAYYADVLDSVVGGALTVTGAEYGSMVCGSEIDGAGEFGDNGHGVQLGVGGALGICEQAASVWGGDVTVSGTAGLAQVSQNIIRGNLDGAGNDSVSASDNRVRGQIQGQFAEQTQPRSLRLEADAQAQTARGDIEELRAERLGTAEEQAELAGPAGL